MKRNKSIIFISGLFALFLIVLMIGIGGVLGSKKGANEVETEHGKELSELVDDISYMVSTSEPVKGQVNIGDSSSLYDELPEIDKYPISVEGNGDIDIEVFTSGEKAGKDTDSWLIKSAESLNKMKMTTSGGETVSLTVRSVPSGVAADYIISGKYLPDLYTPSNEIFAEYAVANGGSLELYNKRLVGNTAGVLVKKDSQHTTIQGVIDTVISGSFNFGYTNPQSSAAGANLLLEILKGFSDDGSVENDTAISVFTKFNNNIPYIAYTTQQMRDSATGGALDGMVTEYQAYINDSSLTSQYKFIPFGMRHDNPLYVVDPSGKAKEEMEAIQIVNDYLVSEEPQELATKYGFNANDDYESSYETDGAEIVKALDIYKTKKDAGKDIIAVFVTDCSGSMDGDAMSQLKQSLSNGMQYINENNYIGLVSYASDVTIEVPLKKFDLTQKSYFQGAVDHMQANGATSSYEAVCVGLDMILAEKENHPDAKCMLFLLSDGHANGSLSLKDIGYAISESKVPIYTIGYTSSADTEELSKLSSINEATSINADSDDIVYKIKSLFNAQL